MAPVRAREHPHEIRRPSNANTIDSYNDSDDEFHHVRTQAVPLHPLLSMQGPFEESMLDATGASEVVPFQIPNLTVELRQQFLCKESDARELDWNFSYNCHWRHNPKGKYHPLCKTLSQITFGIHLLHQHLEKSVADVAEIMLKHVNELDSFLQRASDDIESSLKDMLFRRKCLKVPMEHVNEFDRLLDDRMYRAQLLDGNITIERTINRMSQLLNDYLIDMSTFRDANNELDLYLSRLGDEWTEDNEDVARIYNAMCGNTAGWAQFIQSLTAKSEKLGVVLVQVSSYCNEIEKRCGAASRRSLIASRSSSRNSNILDAARFRTSTDNKPLPNTPHQQLPLITLSSPTKDNMAPLSKNAKARTAGTSGPFADNPSIESMENHERMAAMASFFKNTIPPSEQQVESKVRTRKSNFYDDASSYDGSSEGVDERQQHKSNTTHSSDGEDGDDLVVPMQKPLRGMGGGHVDGSPPLTAKDSAYSSAAASFNSPVPVHRPSPRTNLGLFPPSQPETPRYPASTRNASTADLTSCGETTVATQRSQSAMDMYTANARGLLKKKASLSALKKLFTRKKHDRVDSIQE